MWWFSVIFKTLRWCQNGLRKLIEGLNILWFNRTLLQRKKFVAAKLVTLMNHPGYLLKNDVRRLNMDKFQPLLVAGSVFFSPLRCTDWENELFHPLSCTDWNIEFDPPLSCTDCDTLVFHPLNCTVCDTETDWDIPILLALFRSEFCCL